jgi:acyl-CoA reductase-like NAD-dependent aldehyde dehydrogenase
MTAYDHLDLQPIAGKWRHGRSTCTLIDTDPFDGTVLAEIPAASKEDVDEAYAGAAKAAVSWGSTSPADRAAILTKAAGILQSRTEELVSWLVRESGGTILKAQIECHAAHGITLASASFPERAATQTLTSEFPHKESRVYRQPLGVVGVISPWNFPLHLTARSLAPALAMGNAVVVKPASDTPLTGGLLLARVFEEAGLPPGVLSVVAGAGSEIGDYFVEHPVPRLISFTGSTEVGRRVGALAAGGRYIKRAALELGGNSPFVVLDDADLERAAQAAVFGKFLHQGQICMAVNRIIVDESVHDEFVELFLAGVRRLRCGDPKRAETSIGPVINRQQLYGLQNKAARARQEGARVLLAGEAEGQVLPPHVFDGVTAGMSIGRDEIFGPLAPILRASDQAHALALANDTEYGLSGAVFTRDIERGVRFAQQIDAGMSHVNDIPVQDEVNAPFGGERNSGLGRFGGEWVIAELTRPHWITIQHEPRPYPF